MRIIKLISHYWGKLASMFKNKPKITPLLNCLLEYSEIQNWKTKNMEGPEPKSLDWVWHEIFRHKEDGVNHYNNSLFKLFNGIISSNDVINEIDLIFDELDAKHKVLFTKALQELSKESVIEGFMAASLNLLEIANLQNNLDSITQDQCLLYQQAYEVEETLLILLVLLELHKNGNLNFPPTNLFDNKQNLKKGNTITYIKARIDKSKFPNLYDSFNSAYNIDLRNIIGHNKYKRFDDKIESTDSKISISRDDFFNSLTSCFKIKNAILNCLQREREADILMSLSNSGILGLGFDIVDKKPILDVFQLWCFSEIEEGEDKKWLNAIQFDYLGKELIISCGSYSTKQISLSVCKKWLRTVHEIKNYSILFIHKIYPHYTNENHIIKLKDKNFNVDLNPLRTVVKVIISDNLKHKLNLI